MALKSRNWIIAIGTLLMAMSVPAVAAQATEVRTFPTLPGDSVVIQNDFGRIRVSPWERPEIEIRIRRISTSEEKLDDVSVVAEKSASRIFVQTYFYDFRAESVLLDIQAPDYLNVIVWGANPAVELTGVNGYVRVHTLTGLITAENLGSTATLATESGDIVYRAGLQPSGDIRLESVRGAIFCRIQKDLNLRGWFRAGSVLNWNDEVEVSKGSLERQLGIGGPMLYANSLEGSVELTLDEGMQAHSEVAARVAELNPAVWTNPSTGGDQPASRNSSNGSSEAVNSGSSGGPRTSGSADFEEGARPAPVAVASGNARDGSFSLRVDVDWVFVNASVRDMYTGRALANLSPHDFALYEDGVLQRIEKLETTDAPFHLLLLVDVSGSTRSFIEDVKRAASHFVRELKDQDRVAIAVFNSNSRLIQPFTSSRGELERAISSIRSGGGTAFYDALRISIQDYMRGVEGRKAIVVFSDGVDNQLTGQYSSGSRTTFPELFRQIQEIDTIIYPIFLDSESEFGTHSRRGSATLGGILGDIVRGRPSQSRWGSDPAYDEARRQMRQIAEQTGGVYFEPDGLNDLGRAFSQIAADLRIQYTLGYHSNHPPLQGQWRAIELKVVNRPDVTVRTRKGYYVGTN